jgi:hypothetical protein
MVTGPETVPQLVLAAMEEVQDLVEAIREEEELKLVLVSFVKKVSDAVSPSRLSQLSDIELMSRRLPRGTL